MVAGRDLEGVAETLKEAGQIADIDLNHLTARIATLVGDPPLREQVEAGALGCSTQFSWESQAWKHYQLGERVLAAKQPGAAPPPPSAG